ALLHEQLDLLTKPQALAVPSPAASPRVQKTMALASPPVSSASSTPTSAPLSGRADPSLERDIKLSVHMERHGQNAAASHGPLSMSHSAQQEKKTAALHYRVSIDRNPQSEWPQRDPTVVLELAEAMVHFDVRKSAELRLVAVRCAHLSCVSSGA